MTVGENSKIRQDDPALYAGPVAESSTQMELAPAHGVDPDTGTSMVEPLISPAIEPIGVLPSKEPEKTILPEGKTLRLLAQDIFGDREFWVYIYLENRDKIPNPNRVPSGTELLLPDKSVYSIDAADPQSVAKAKSLGDEILGEF